MIKKRHLVDADKFVADLFKEFHGAISDSELKVHEVIGLIMDRPYVDAVETVHGNWHIMCKTHVDNHTGEVDEEFYLECSECHRKVWDVNQTDVLSDNYEKICADFPYCHCGAKMKIADTENR